jgi:septum formation protein
VACARDGEIVWHSVEMATLKMRRFEPVTAAQYLARAGEAALLSVGAYQLESMGVQLFEAIDGDYFAILGLPLLPLLGFLREEGAEGILQ